MIRRDLPIEDGLDDLADQNKWASGRIINNFKAAPTLCTQCNQPSETRQEPSNPRLSGYST